MTPDFDVWPGAGVYQLWIRLRRPTKAAIGALGEIQFAAGMYVYTGRASRGLRARVARHLSQSKRLHWHIDYLLARRDARIVRVVLASADPEDECRVNAMIARQGIAAVPRFGASDCQCGCLGHLWRVSD